METSNKGELFLKRHESDVLKAYLCPAGKWTIGVGLTKASGVVAPKSGMVISREESSRLLKLALKRNYEPSVNAAMPGAKQHEFDGGVSFHWNTGAIGRASWVKSWLKHDWDGVQSGLMSWIRGNGKVLPGLQRRRAEEFNLIRNGIYVGVVGEQAGPRLASVVLVLSAENLIALRKGLTSLGYFPGPDKRGVDRIAILAFQRDHDLTADGVIGRATLSTIQRMLDARTKTKAPAAVAVASGAGTQTDQVSDLAGSLPWIDWLAWGGLTLCLIWLAWIAFKYRDALAVKVQARLPVLAAFLRRI